MNSSSQPGEPLGVVGMGGYAGHTCRDLLARKTPHPLHLAAVHDPNAESFPLLLAQLKHRGIPVYKTYDELLATPVKAVCLPIPIDLHRPFAEKALRAGKAVLCEKPAAGSIQDVDAMIRARDAARLPLAIGYQQLYSPATHLLKQRLLAGDIGSISDATVYCAWERSSAYYSRPWAGKLQRNGAWILDSPANNAIAHFVHLTLFLLGPSPMQSARPLAIEAELYRANPIDNYDTCCLRLTLDSGPKVLIALTHACAERRHSTISLFGNAGHFIYDTARDLATFYRHGIETLRQPLSRFETSQTLDGFAALLHDPSQPHASLEMSRMHALVISGASQCSPVITIPQEHITLEPRGRATLCHVPGLVYALDAAIAQRQMLHETRLVPWTRPAQHLDLRNYAQFTGPPVP